MATEAFWTWFADTYGEQFDKAKRIRGACTHCGREGEVLVVGRTGAFDGYCEVCLGMFYGWDDAEEEVAKAAIRGVLDARWPGAIPTREEMQTLASDAVTEHERHLIESELTFARAQADEPREVWRQEVKRLESEYRKVA